MKREAVSSRTRFEVFKRDSFTCRYCGRQSPNVVLEVDHIVAVANGGTNDLMNLATSCWTCNSGKSAVLLADVVTGEDPHDRAVLLLERERQLQEYNAVLATVNARIESDLDRLIDVWPRGMTPAEETGLEHLLAKLPAETIISAMVKAIRNRKTRSLAYVYVLLREHDV